MPNTAPCNTPEAEEGDGRRAFAVRFTRQSINSDAYRINLWADSQEEALARFADWRNGMIELEPDEEESDHHVKDYGIVDGHGEVELDDGFEPEEIDPVSFGMFHQRAKDAA